MPEDVTPVETNCEQGESDDGFFQDESQSETAPLTDSAVGRLKDQFTLLERRVAVLEGEREAGATPGTVTDFLPTIEGSPGIVVDPGVARASSCTRFDLGDGKELVYSKGVIGPLDESQKALYCPETVTKPLTEAQQRRLRDWRESAHTCKREIAGVPKGEKLEPWLTCMSRELSAKGIEIK